MDETSFELVKASKSIMNDGGSGGGSLGYVAFGVGETVGVVVAVGWGLAVGSMVAVGVGWIVSASLVSLVSHPVASSADITIMRKTCTQNLWLKIAIARPLFVQLKCTTAMN